LKKSRHNEGITENKRIDKNQKSKETIKQITNKIISLVDSDEDNSFGKENDFIESIEEFDSEDEEENVLQQHPSGYSCIFDWHQGRFDGDYRITFLHKK
jgi:hypothetical protein